MRASNSVSIKMTDYDDHPDLKGYPIDGDYCRDSEQRADTFERDGFSNSDTESDTDDNAVDEETTLVIGGEEIAIENIDVSFEDNELEVDGEDWSFLFGGYEGDGAASSLDELIDKNAIIENDGRSDTRTFYYVQDVDEDERKRFSRMLKWQDGVGDKNRRSANAAADKRRWIDAFGTQLGCTPLQKETAKQITASMNFKYFGNYSSEKVILGIISLVCERDERFIRHEPAFQRLMESVELDQSGLRTCRRMVRERSSQFDESPSS
jgi:hypothetical protein